MDLSGYPQPTADSMDGLHLMYLTQMNEHTEANEQSLHSLGHVNPDFRPSSLENNEAMDLDDFIRTLQQQHLSVTPFVTPQYDSVDGYLALTDPGSHPALQQHQVPSHYDDHAFLTPLVSPALTPAFSPHSTSKVAPLHDSASVLSAIHFSPLSSPALLPQGNGHMFSSQSMFTGTSINDKDLGQMTQSAMSAPCRLQEQAKRHGDNQQSDIHDQNASTVHPETSPTVTPSEHLKHRQGSGHRKHQTTAATSPWAALNSSIPLSSGPSPSIVPVTPGSLMKLKGDLQSTHKSTSTDEIVAQTSDTVPDADTSLSATSNRKSLKKRKRRGICRGDPKHILTSPRALKPLLVHPPRVDPLWSIPNSTSIQNAERILATRSNYQNLMEGKGDVLGIAFTSTIKSGLEVRRTAHKAAEQRRRDSLKEWLELLRHEVEDGYVKKRQVDNACHEHKDKLEDQGTPDDVNTGKPLPRALLLKYTYDYIMDLKHTVAQKDKRVEQLLCKRPKPSTH